MTELKICPFCGGIPKLFQPAHQAIVQCQRCFAEVEGAQGDKDHAIAAWNKRAVGPQRQALVDALKAWIDWNDGTSWLPDDDTSADRDFLIARSNEALKNAGEL